MSDMTTITPKERALWLSEAQPKNIDYYEPIDFELDKRIRKLIGALEQAESRAEKAEKELAGADAEISELRDELEDSRGTEKDAPNILCAIARLVGVYEHSQEIGDDMGEMTLDAVRDLLTEKQKAEAENARLTKMVDWLADKSGTGHPDCPLKYITHRPLGWKCHEGSQGPCTKQQAAGCWKEAASWAVAAGEETCQK